MNRYQFSLRDLFRLTTLAAVVFTIMRVFPPEVYRAVTVLIAAFAASMATGVAVLFVTAAFADMTDRVLLRARQWRLRRPTDERSGTKAEPAHSSEQPLSP